MQDKRDFNSIATKFGERYATKATQASSMFAVQNEMLSLVQSEVEHIHDYVHRAEKLSRKIPKEMDSLFAIAFIKGMKDQKRHQRITFDLKDSPNFSFIKALEIVKFSFQEIGEPDPFRPTQKSHAHESSAPTLYSSLAPTVNAVAKTDVLLAADSKSGPLASFTQEQFNQYMANYEATVRRTSRSFGGQQGALRRPNMRVTCFNCGLRGHYSDSCTNPPVSAYEQQQVHDTICHEREQQD